jgi:hypothetical protein
VVDPAGLVHHNFGGFVVWDVNNVFFSRLNNDCVVFNINFLFVVSINVACGIGLLANFLYGGHQSFFLVDYRLTQLPGPIYVVIEQCQRFWVIQ